MIYDPEFYCGKRVFVTGHTGFKGSWLCRMLLHAGAIVTGYSLPAPTEPALFELASIKNGMTSTIGDIRDYSHLQAAFAAAKPEIVFHLAAQPLVRESYRNPVDTYEINVMGTVYLLECIRTAQAPVQSAVIITTDKVYQNKEWVWGYREDEPLNGYEPYSNSKSCADLAVQSYQRSFFHDTGTSISIVRAGNVIGGGDFAQDRILPDCVRAALTSGQIVLRNPNSIRPYQHVLEALSAYLMIGQRQFAEPRCAGFYNVGPDEIDCVTTARLAALFCEKWGGLTWRAQTESDALHESNFLKLDCTRLKTTFNWRPQWHVDRAVEATVAWVKAWQAGQNPAEIMDRQIDAYLEEKHNAGMEK